MPTPQGQVKCAIWQPDDSKRGGFGQTKQLLPPATGNLLDNPGIRCR